jgi:predicted metal-dependent hydrolase
MSIELDLVSEARNLSYDVKKELLLSNEETVGLRRIDTMTIQIDKIIRSRRNSIYLLVDTDAKLTVKAPLGCSKRAIRESVERHKDWILRKQKLARARHEPSCSKKYIAGEKFLYLGNEH